MPETILTEEIVQIGESAAVMTWLLLLLFAALIGLFFVWGWWITNREGSKDPYTRTSLAPASRLSFSATQKVHSYLSKIHNLDNPYIDLSKAAVARETGRIYPNAINRFGVIKVGWSFLNKRYPGDWISWGALQAVEKEAVQARHPNFDGFQLEYSCTHSQPSQITEDFAWQEPGPLYVDIDTKTLLGWKRVPGTELEVMVVQKPQEQYSTQA